MTFSRREVGIEPKILSYFFSKITTELSGLICELFIPNVVLLFKAQSHVSNICRFYPAYRDLAVGRDPTAPRAPTPG